MARRSDHTREELEELAINAGIALIEERGFSKFSARAVAGNMGYTVGTLYYLFGTLDEFILRINARTLDLWYEDLKKALGRQKQHPIQTLGKAYINFCRANRNRWSALYEHQPQILKKVPNWYGAKLDRLFALVEESLISYTGRATAKRAAKILWAGIHGLCVLSLAGKLEVVGAESVEMLAKDFIDKFLAGLSRTK